MGFLTIEQRQRYGRYGSEPTPMQLARYFHLDDTDREAVKIRRGDHNRLGFALQLCTVRFLGTFLVNPIDVPPGVVSHVATQLDISNIKCLPQYLERSITHWEHVSEIQQRSGYQDFSEQPGHWQLVRWLYGRTSAPALVSALNRLVEVREFGVSTLNLDRIPTSRLKALARHASVVRVQAIARNAR